ncbi:hypothetical protein F5Y01DRAFT_319118 [Xylaria sp. FL0043]|nr:hypothetical protein F5Y01DRAFT_319118 [Xylaria sp. FL0043]
MQKQDTQVSPFRVHVLHAQTYDQTDASQCAKANLGMLLPASYRTPTDDLAPPRLRDDDYFEKELGVGRLRSLSAWLWVAGRPMPARPLHYQLLLGREIVLVEQMDLHLVWTSGRMFLKPIPRYLLEPCFWTIYLACPCDPPCTQSPARPCAKQRLRRSALGFLFSYAALLCYESDFILARERHLLPEQVQWHDWRKLVEELDTEHIYTKIDARYIYGELRLSRLNKIQYLHSSAAFRGYMSPWNRYGDFFYYNFTWLTSATVYIAIVLTALQVGLATEALARNRIFQSASYGFTIFSIVGPLAAVGLIICIFSYIFVSNWVATVAYRKQRLLHIHEKAKTA